MSDPVQRILTALRGHGHEPKRAGAGWCCRCPAHDDRNPSLSIHAGDGGRVLVNCHAGCTFDAVCAAIGLRPADLFADDPSRRNGHTPRARRGVTVTNTAPKPARGGGFGDSDAKTYPTAREAVAAMEQRNGPRAAAWTYHDAKGEPVGLVVRWNTPTRKVVRPVSRKADGSGWVIRKVPSPHPLYRLPNLLATPAGSRVWVCEGEKAVEAARAVGLVATTSAGGAERAKGSDWSPVAGREVVILPDHDEAGEKYADDVARLATAAGAKSVRIVRLVELWAGMPEGGDMADLVNDRGGDVDPIRADVEALTDKTNPEKSKPIDGAPVIVRLSDVQPRAIDWLWGGRIPRGRLSLLAGRPGEGKSMATMDWAARVTMGAPWPDGGACPSGSVVLVAGEDDPGDTIRPRLDAHGADVSRVHLLQSVVRLNSKGGSTEAAFTLADLGPLEVTLQRVPDCALVIIDPIGSFIGGDTDADKDNKVRAVLAPLGMLAQRTGAAIVLVAHQRKGTATHADDLVMGSRAFTGICRSVLHLLTDPDDNQRRLLLPGKMNLARPAEGLAFTICGHPPRIEWEPEPVAMTADSVLAAQSGGQDDPEPPRVAEWMERHGRTATVNALVHGMRAFRAKPAAARAALVEVCGEPEWVQGAKGGRPTEVFRLPVSVTVTGTPPIPERNGGISDGDTGNAAAAGGKGWGEL